MFITLANPRQRILRGWYVFAEHQPISLSTMPSGQVHYRKCPGVSKRDVPTRAMRSRSGSQH
jgi:hypothetical protein